MNDANVSTGLPELPPNRFWRVRSYTPPWFRTEETTCAMIEMIEKKEVMQRQPREILGMQFGWHKEPISVILEEVILVQILWDPNHPVPEGYTGRIVDIDGEKYLPVSPSEIKPSMILEAARRTIVRYGAKRMSESLMGDYPPNRLPGVGEKQN